MVRLTFINSNSFDTTVLLKGSLTDKEELRRLVILQVGIETIEYFN